MKRLVLSVLMAIAAMRSVSPQALKILCENDAPGQFPGPDGKLTGGCVEIVREIQKRVGNEDEIRIVPWARGYDMIQKEPNVVLFSMIRTGGRDALFNWVGPILDIDSGLYAKSGSTITLSSLDDARKVGSIGVYLDDVRDQILTKAGFANLDRTTDNVSNVRKLMAGRIDLYASSSVSFAADTRAAGFKPSDLKLALTFYRGQIYVAMSKGMPGRVVNAWNAALEAMRKDGSFLRILKRFYPDAELPGPAITEF